MINRNHIITQMQGALKKCVMPQESMNAVENNMLKNKSQESKEALIRKMCAETLLAAYSAAYENIEEKA